MSFANSVLLLLLLLPLLLLLQLRISSREVSDRLLDIRVQLAMLANRQTRLDNPMLEARIKRIKLVLDGATGLSPTETAMQAEAP